MTWGQAFVGVILGTTPCAAFAGGAEAVREPTVVVAPEYPDVAHQARIEGQVTVRVRFDARGKVTAASEVEGNKFLVPSAIAAARLWEFGPGESVSSSRDIVFVYSLLPENACFQKILPRFVPPSRVEIARRRLVPTCLDCGPDKTIVYQTCE